MSKLCENCAVEHCADRNRGQVIFCSSHAAKKVQTHADQIRAMSDEELADAIVKMACGIDPAESFCQSKKECEDLMDADKEIPEEWCRQCVLAMLRQPAEV